ncbi:MAG: 2-oxoglutarate dehydrogenase E1 component [Opitutaceae bacterium]|jgi:2-oxoglutarate dehydrogenase E1 component|nr:2-oxoglutarate dehydrogenase E1 component [Opitutaceae bacterium]
MNPSAPSAPSALSARDNADLIEAAWRVWLDNPDAVDPTWRAFFQGFTLGCTTTPPVAPTPPATPPLPPTLAIATPSPATDPLKQSQVHSLIYHYRSLGHLQAHLDPLNPPPPPSPRLSLAEFGLAESDLDATFDVGHYLDGDPMRLRDLIASLENTYCDRIGVEYIHIPDTEIRRWLQTRMEPPRLRPAFARDQKLRILRRLHQAELFEKFLHAKYVGQKRFSLEGGETLIAALDALIEHCPALGIEEIVMGMAHRGRLSVLANILRKPFDILFEQFSENYLPDTVGGDGDVKYHLGYEARLDTTAGPPVEVRLAANPSHLEIVDPVVEGKTRARQYLRGDTATRAKVLPLLLHGDAAIAGQGIVAETLNFSQLPGYRTGGTLHLVINNQIGFTTLPDDARSTRYCTDVAKTIDAPIFHVNGDDPEAVCLVALLALDFRNTFHRDAVVDLYCYRRHGHNESDEPAFTQPTLYKKIAAHPLISTTYAARLIADGTLTAADNDAIKTTHTAAMEAAFAKARTAEEKPRETPAASTVAISAPATSATSAANNNDPATRRFRGSNAIFQPPYKHTPVPTGAPLELLKTCARALTTLPDGFNPNPKIKRLLETRAKTLASDGPIDWGCAEALAFGTLLLEGTPVRLSGQDCERGTFSHRHAVLYDQETRARHVPLQNLAPRQAEFSVYNSLLSEAAVLAFDYGYSMDYPAMLCLWEAQFGDFANGAQVVIDQFIVSSESKWQRASGLVLLLPHGYEGQGPEHSSARLERYLQACAENNIQVANLTTPAQIFHILRRQMKRDFRKPLVIMAPKSLLRHPAATSRIPELTTGRFEEILDDPAPPEKPPARLILCSGKVYYDLADYRARQNLADTALLRIEQLYPLHRDRLAELSDAYGHGSRLVWCQEEPQNMGAWTWIAPQLEEIFGRKPACASRKPSASPAVGALALHKLELATLLKDAFNL